MKKRYSAIVLKVLVSIVAFYTVLGFILLPYLIQTNFSKVLKQTTNASGYLEKIYINPYTFEVELKNLLIQDDKNKTLVYFNTLQVDLELSSLLDNIVHIKQIYLYDLKTNIVLDKNNQTNFQYIIDFLENNSKNSESTSETQANNETSPIYFKIDNINLKNNRITFEDFTKTEPFKVDTKKFNVKLHDISLLPDEKGKLFLDVDIEDSFRLKMNSNLSLNPIRVDGDLILDNLRIDKINSYIKDDIDFKLNGERINLDLKYNVELNGDIKAKITDLNTLVYRVKYQKDDISVYLGALKNKIETIDIEKKQESLSIDLNGQLLVEDIRANKSYKIINGVKDFKFDVNKIDTNLSYKVSLKDEKIDVVVDDTNIVLKDISYETKDLKVYLPLVSKDIKKVVVKKQKDDINLLVKDIVLKDTNLHFTDLTKKELINLEIKNINAKVDEVTLDKNLPIKFNLSLNTPQKGLVSTAGEVIIEPLKVDIDLKTKDIVFKPYLPYVNEFVNIDLKSGSLSSDLSIKVDKKDEKIEPKIDGDISINNFSLFHSLTNKKLFSFNQLSIEGLKYINDDLNINNVVLDSSYTSFKIAKDKTTNFDNIMVSTGVENETNDESTKQVEKTDEKSSFKYFVKNIELKDSKTDFSDLSLPLPFATKIHSLKANVKNISSSDATTNVKLTGIVDEYGMATITGDINTANFKKQTDIKIDFENLDVTSFSPYSGKFIGNKIAKGKLWLDLTYKIRDSNLTSANNMRIKDLTLGEKVESVDAVDLPIGFVIALLEDSDGFIDVDVPVQGNIDNPEFKLGGAIWGAVGNVITNIITSPFRFLGSLLGIDSDELGSLDFEYGQTLVLPPQKEKLDNLIKALNKKPNLSLVIHPIYNEIEDLAVLKKERFLNLIDKQSKEDKNSFIKELFIKKFGEKEYNLILKSKEIKNKIEMFSSRLIESMIITNEELKDLAYNRAKSIEQYCLSKKLNKNRIVIDKTIEIVNIVDLKRITMTLDVDIKKKEE